MKTMKTLLSASLALTALSGCQPETEKPNILFLLVDDMQSDAIAALGNKNVYTPNIDGLIAEGVTFTRTYTNGALCGALSMPSRAMLMTGRGVFEVQKRRHEDTRMHGDTSRTITSQRLSDICYRQMAFRPCLLQPFVCLRREHLLRWDASLRKERTLLSPSASLR